MSVLSRFPPRPPHKSTKLYARGRLFAPEIHPYFLNTRLCAILRWAAGFPLGSSQATTLGTGRSYTPGRRTTDCARDCVLCLGFHFVSHGVFPRPLVALNLCAFFSNLRSMARNLKSSRILPVKHIVFQIV
jgi:hypothetical protein